VVWTHPSLSCTLSGQPGGGRSDGVRPASGPWLPAADRLPSQRAPRAPRGERGFVFVVVKSGSREKKPRAGSVTGTPRPDHTSSGRGLGPHGRRGSTTRCHRHPLVANPRSSHVAVRSTGGGGRDRARDHEARHRPVHIGVRRHPQTHSSRRTAAQVGGFLGDLPRAPGLYVGRTQPTSSSGVRGSGAVAPCRWAHTLPAGRARQPERWQLRHASWA
jgi:hypothetical protein